MHAQRLGLIANSGKTNARELVSLLRDEFDGTLCIWNSKLKRQS